MRSRYSAFVLQLSDYLLASWHSSSRPPSLRVEDSPTWKALHVLSSSQQQTQGRVHFRALYKEAKHWGFLEEESQFVQEQGHWYYLTGTTREGQLKPGRNDPCPCGSGKKYKACCV